MPDGGCVVLKIVKKNPCVKIDVRELLHRTPEIWLMGVYPFRYVRPDQKKQVLKAREIICGCLAHAIPDSARPPLIETCRQSLLAQAKDIFLLHSGTQSLCEK